MLITNILLILIINHSKCLEFIYHNNSDLEYYLKNFTRNIEDPIKTSLYSIGKSTKGTNLWVVKITAAPQDESVPNIKLIGTIHGNEPVGREILLHFLEYLRSNYKLNETVAWLLNNTKIHILPNFNPDGFEMANEGLCSGEHGRNNGPVGKDLNRNFPDFYHHNKIPEEPETRAMKRWMSQVSFVLSAGLHGGALVANYPFDTVKEKKWQMFLRNIKNVGFYSEEATKLRHEYIASLPKNPPSLTPDDDIFKHLASVYSQSHATMHKGIRCNKEMLPFEGGVTNGAAWYPLTGGMQDYNYVFHGCMEITLEISCCKYPNAEQLPILWEENKSALINYCLQANQGVKGIVCDSSTKEPIEKVAMKIIGRNMTFFTNNKGEFWRILLPGQYLLELSSPGYYDKIVSFEVKDYKDSFTKMTDLKINLKKLSLGASLTTTTEVISTPMMVISAGITTTSTTTTTTITKTTVPTTEIDVNEEQIISLDENVTSILTTMKTTTVSEGMGEEEEEKDLENELKSSKVNISDSQDYFLIEEQVSSCSPKINIYCIILAIVQLIRINCT